MSVGLRALAESLGLSITTVSRALAGYADVSASTRIRVVEAARAAGYRPNKAAQRLQSGRADAIGLALPQGAGSYDDPFFAELLAAVGAALAEHDLDLVLSVPRPGEDDVALITRLIDSRRVDGLIIPRTRWNDPRVDLLLARDIPFVTHGRTARQAEHAWHDVDGAGAIRIAMERLIGFGHRRIAFINAPLDFAYARHRLEGYRTALMAAGIAIDPAIMRDGPATSEAGEAAAHDLLRLASPPTAIMCATDRLAYGVLTAARAAGRQAGGDLSVIGYDDLVASAHQAPPLTTMRQAIRNEGAALVTLLRARIAGADPATLQDLTQATLIARQSDGPAP
jgi:LacI family transcriptional regulator